MGDSDDDYERRRRDKFRGERSDYSGPGRERRDERRREDWNDSNSFRGRDSWGGRDRGGGRREFGREYVRSRERYSPVRHDMSPPMKRMRSDWGEERRYPFESNYTNYGAYGHDYTHRGGHVGGSSGGGRFEEVGPTQPPMMTFKAFMEQCDDTISEEDALKKYSDYKLEFKRLQLNEFFVGHKEEEWFKTRFHPEECIKRKTEQIENLKRRVAVFSDLDKSNRIDKISLDADQSDEILKLLDCVVIKLEGGTDLDLDVLDLPPEEEKAMSMMPYVNDDKFTLPFSEYENDEQNKKENKDENITEEQELRKKAQDLLKSKPSEGENSRKRKRSHSGSEISLGSDSEEEPAAPGTEEVEPPPPGMEEKKVEEKEEGETVEGDLSKEDMDCHITGTETIEPKVVDNEDDKNSSETKEKEDSEPKPRALHKSASIFLRNLAPTITKHEVESMCKRYNGFLRAAIADPQPERRWFRRGWVTFKRDVNIKDICWNLNNIRLRDCELGAIVNKDLTRRIRTVNGITSHKNVVKSDIKLAAKIIQNLDSRWGLWLSIQNGQPVEPVGLSNSANPALRNITDYLIEEASAEEEELLGNVVDKENTSEAINGQDKTDGETIERDEIIIQVLDRLLMYLRMVHSVDYYNHSEYPNEDEMPNRCGIMHARGIPPSSKVTNNEIHDYCKAFENKIGSFLQPLTKLLDEDAGKLGLKNSEDEVDKFVQSNTLLVSKDKYLCPLCQKKFKAAEFVNKHILNKHKEKVDEVRTEVDYFNNYLRDPKRPQLPEYPGNKQSTRKEDFRPDPYVASYPQQAPQMYGYANYGNRYPAPAYAGYSSNYPKDYYNRESYPREPYQRPRAAYRSRSGESREIIGYQDLDTPEDKDLF